MARTFALPRGPPERATAQDMAMQVGNGFPGVRTVVEDQAKAGFGQAEFGGNFTSFEQQMAKELLLFGPGFGDARNALFGNDQHMNWSLWFNVVKGQDVLILIHDFGGYFAVDNFFKQGLAHGKGKLRRLEQVVN
jgi:hypothetical protein